MNPKQFMQGIERIKEDLKAQIAKDEKDKAQIAFNTHCQAQLSAQQAALQMLVQSLQSTPFGQTLVLCFEQALADPAITDELRSLLLSFAPSDT